VGVPDGGHGHDGHHHDDDHAPRASDGPRR
jgi:hypothetical protein